MNTATLDYATLKAVRDSHLDLSGIGHDAPDEFSNQIDQINATCAPLIAGAIRQAHYNLFTNVPCGIMERSECTADAAIKSALAGFCGTLVKWDINATRAIAADILEDVNAHDEAAALRAKIA